MNHDNQLFYDIEVLKYDSLVVFLDYDENIKGVFWSKRYDDMKDGQHIVDRENGFEGVEKFIEGKTLIGYNNHYYDDVIISTMMNGRNQWEIKRNNDRLISGNADAVPLPERERARKMATLDCFQQIDLSKPSLKKIEGNMGVSIKESSIPFDIDRPLTDDERDELLTYCVHDVRCTVKVFKLREKNYFETREELVKMLRKTDDPGWNTTTLATNILLSKPLTKWAWLKGIEPEWAEEIKTLHPKLWEMWNDKNSEEKKYKIHECGCEIVFGSGGLHGVHETRKKFENVKLLDVGSMYPSIIRNINALGDATEFYDGMRQERLKIKHSDPVRAGALKLILNSVYGLLKNQYSLLFNPWASNSVCVYGQIALYDLCRELDDAGYTVMNINTDGVAFVDDRSIGDVRWQQIQKRFEEKFKLSLELDEFDYWIQRDVNNYIATHDGKIKVKGGDCNKYHDPGKLFANNDARIIQIALVDHLLTGKPVPAIIGDPKYLARPELYQYVLRAGRTYQGVIDDKGCTDYNNVNRIFPAKKGVEGSVKLFKHRMDGGLVNFPDMPERMYVWNDDISEFDNFRSVIDLNHFCSVVYKKLKAWR